MNALQHIAGVLYHALMLAGSVWCHQRPERSPHLWGLQMPLCWRCSGILIGAVLLLGWLIAKKRLPSLAMSLTFAFLMPLDVLGAVIGLWPGDNTLRLFTGLLWGVGSTSVALHFLQRGAVLAHNSGLVDDGYRRCSIVVGWLTKRSLSTSSSP